jgi:hypothetical protein
LAALLHETYYQDHQRGKQDNHGRHGKKNTASCPPGINFSRKAKYLSKKGSYSQFFNAKSLRVKAVTWPDQFLTDRQVPPPYPEYFLFR